MESVESQISKWRAYVARSPALNGQDVDELEDHLRHQIADLTQAGLTPDEGFLIAVKRMGDVDALSREFAREHSNRLWKQLLASDDEPARAASGWLEALLFAAAAALTIQVARLAAGFPDDEGGDPTWFVRDSQPGRPAFPGRVLRPSTAARPPRWVLTAVPFARRGASWSTSIRTTRTRPPSCSSHLHLPVVLWFAVAYPYMGGTIRSHQRRMDFVRFTGEWFIYYVLIALGGGVLMALTGGILEPTGSDFDRVAGWVLPSGAAGAVVVAAWLVESKQQVIENMAPVLTMLFTPLFAVMLTCRRRHLRRYSARRHFDRELAQCLRRPSGRRPRRSSSTPCRLASRRNAAWSAWTASSWSPS